MTDNYNGILTRVREDFPTIHAQRKRDWYFLDTDDCCINKYSRDSLGYKIDEGLEDWVRISPEVLTRW